MLIEELLDGQDGRASQHGVDQHGVDQQGAEYHGEWRYDGRAAHQAPEVDGATEVRSPRQLAVGDLVRVRVSGSEGVDLVADLIDEYEQGHPGQSRTIE